MGVRPVGSTRVDSAASLPAAGNAATNSYSAYPTASPKLLDSILPEDTGSAVELYIHNPSATIAYVIWLRVDYSDSTAGSSADWNLQGDVSDTATQDFSWDGTAYKSTSKSTSKVNVSPPADTTKPTAPTGLNVTGTTESTIDLAWTAATDNVGVTGYNIYEGTTKVNAAPIAALTYTVTGLTAATSHTYTVTALDAAGNESVKSAPATGTTVDLTAPAAPAGLIVTDATQFAISLAWTAPADNVGVVSYNIYEDAVKLNPAPITATTYTVAGLDPSTSHTYSVTALDAAGNESAHSAPVTGTTDDPPSDTTPPSAPTGLAVTDTTQTTISLAWTAATDNVAVTGYNVYEGSTKLTPSPITATTYTATGLTVNTAHTYAVTALDEAGNESVKSAPASATTPDTAPPSVPAGLAVVGTTDTTVGLAWAPSTDNVAVAGYDIYVGETVVNAEPVNATNGDVGGLTPATPYTFTVRAVDTSANKSARSAPVAATTSAEPPSPEKQAVMDFLNTDDPRILELL